MFDADIKQCIGAKINYHLLETNRICAANTNDSNFHIFYGLIFGSTDELLKNMCLDPKVSYKVSLRIFPVLVMASNDTIDLLKFTQSLSYTNIEDFFMTT